MGDSSFGALLGVLVAHVVNCMKIDVVVIGTMDEVTSESITSGFDVVTIDSLTVLFDDEVSSNFVDIRDDVSTNLDVLGDDSFSSNFEVVTEDGKTGIFMVVTGDWVTGTVDVVTNDGKAAGFDVSNNESIVDNLCVVTDGCEIGNIDDFVVDSITGNLDIETSEGKTDSFDALTVSFIADNNDVEKSDGLYDTLKAATDERVKLGAVTVGNIICDFDVIFRDDKIGNLYVSICMLVASTSDIATCDREIVKFDDGITCAFDLVTDVFDNIIDDLDTVNSGRTVEYPDISTVDGKSGNSNEVVDEGKDNLVAVFGMCLVDGLDMVITDNIADNLDTVSEVNKTDGGEDGTRETVISELYVLRDAYTPSEMDVVGDIDITISLNEVIANVLTGNLDVTFIDKVKTITDVLGTEDLTRDADEFTGEGKNIDLVMLTGNVTTDKLEAFKGDIVTGNSDIDKVFIDKWNTDVTRFRVVLEFREILKIIYEVSSVAINDFCELSAIILELVNSFET